MAVIFIRLHSKGELSPWAKAYDRWHHLCAAIDQSGEVITLRCQLAKRVELLQALGTYPDVERVAIY